MDKTTKAAIGATAVAVLLSLALIFVAVRGCSSDSVGPVPVPVPDDPVQTSVHDALSGYALGLSSDFAAASNAVRDGEIKTDKELYDFLIGRTPVTRQVAFSVFDQMLQDNLPRDVNKLDQQSAEFLSEVAKAFEREGKHAHE